MKSIEDTLKLALEALKANYLLVNGTEKAGGLAWCIDGYYSNCFDLDPINEQTERAITAIEEALAPQNEVRGLSQPEQRSVSEHLEPVFWWNGGTQLATQKSKEWDKRTGGTTAFGCDIPLYTTPPQRTWVGLTDDEIDQSLLRSDYAFKTAEAWRSGVVFAMTKLKEKNQ